MANTDQHIKSFTEWAHSEDNIIGVYLVGSQAREAATETSDIDLIIIAKDTSLFLTNNFWLERFGETTQVLDEEWGMVKTKRAFYKDGVEIEYGITDKNWIMLPADPGTKKVLTDGNKILVDKSGELANFVKQI